jgi:uncharacterized protein YbaP (TraB family)
MQPSSGDGVGHWHWASSAAVNNVAMQSMHRSMHSNHSRAEEMAWMYRTVSNGDDAMFSSMLSAMHAQSSMHASAHDTEFRRVYMQAALQRSHNLAAA